MTAKECENSSSIGKRKERNFKEEVDSVSMDVKKLNTGLTDLISLLPQDILGDILSRLPTKLAASTSVLSKRWRNLFALVHNLDFDNSVPVQSEETMECFKNFVDRTLALQCDSSIKKFSLKFQNYGTYQMASVCRWITNVVERGVLEFCLCSHECNLPSELFRSKTLVKLTLGSRVLFDPLPQDLFLPALKSLFIDTIYFVFRNFYERLLPGCPVLEELSIHHVNYGGAPYCICSQTIKKLKVYYYSDTYLSTMGDDMSFDAPSLVSLDYTDIVRTKYIKVHLKSLVEAKLNLTYSKNVYYPDLTGLIIGISNVQTLHMSPDTVNAISRCCKRGLLLPVFKNLVNLSFGSYRKKGWKLLSYLLKQTPNLETLTIQSLRGYTDDVTLSPFQVKVLHVLGYGNTAKEIEYLRSFLWGIKCVELVEVEIKKGVVVDNCWKLREIAG